MQSVNESSLSRLWRQGKKYDCGSMSAFTQYNKRAENVQAHKKLGKELRDLGFSVTQIIGGYQYGNENEVTKELSWFVCDRNDQGNLKKALIDKGKEYDQESVLFAPAFGKSHLIWTKPGKNDNGYKIGDRSGNSKSKTWGKRNPNTMAFSKIGNRTFADEIDYDFKIKNMNEQSSNKYKHDFKTVYESYFSRYTAALFTKGDVVTFDKKILSDDAFLAMPEEMQMRVKDMVEAQLAGDAIIAIANVGLAAPATDQYEASSLTLAYSQGGGMYYGQTTVSGSLGKYMKVISGVETLIPKNAIKPATASNRTEVDIDSVRQAFRAGYSPDIRQQKNEKK